MKFFTPAAIALLAAVSGAALISGTATTVVAKEKKAEAPKGGKLSKEAQKLLAEVDKALKASDFATAKTNLLAADALPSKNAYDSWLISQFMFDVGKKTNDPAMTNNAFERMATSEYLPKEYVAGTINERTVLQTLFGNEYNAKNYAKAMMWGDKYLAVNPADGAFTSDMARIALITKNFAKAEDYTLKSLAASKTAGQKPSEFQYASLAEIYQTSKSPKFVPALRDLITAYPTSKNWRYILEDFQLRSKMTDKSSIDLYRLMYATGVLDSQADILEYAFTAFDGGVLTEAQRVIEQNMASGKIGKGNAEAMDTLKRSKTALSTDDPLAKQEVRAAAAKTGDSDVFVGNSYLGAANYPKAIELLKRGIGKGTKATASATVKLGIAQLMSGDKASAKTTFASVAGDAKQTELAVLWSLYTDVK
jgi:hypothetical protein